MANDREHPSQAVLRACYSSLVFCAAAVMFGAFFIAFDRNGTRPIGYFVIAASLVMAAFVLVAIRRVRRGA
jgi:hypothetical protein